MLRSAVPGSIYSSTYSSVIRVYYRSNAPVGTVRVYIRLRVLAFMPTVERADASAQYTASAPTPSAGLGASKEQESRPAQLISTWYLPTGSKLLRKYTVYYGYVCNVRLVSLNDNLWIVWWHCLLWAM